MNLKTINLPIIITNLEALKVKKMFKLGTRSEERLKGVDPRIMKIIQLALTISVIDFSIPKHGGFRDASKCDGIKVKSKHQSGLAFDMCAYVDGKASWDRGHLTQVAAAILQAAGMLGYELHWGGHFRSFVDMPHFELVE